MSVTLGYVVTSFILLPLSFVLNAAQIPVFRGGVDLVHLDVSVLDKNRQPVRGLKPDDFTILEDGKPQQLMAFAAVDLPDVERPITKWMNETSPDVVTNQIDNHRIFALVLDDGLMPKDVWAANAMRKSAMSLIDRMGRDDLATVIFTRDNRGAQDLTSDRVKLKRAVETLSNIGSVPLGSTSAAPPMGGAVQSDRRVPPPEALQYPPCWDYVTSIQVVQRVAEYLSTLPQRRKAVLYLSGGMQVDIGARRVAGPIFPLLESYRLDCGAQVVAVMEEAFRQAQRGNVNIYGLDPMGLRADAALGSTTALAIEFLQTVSDNTGGHAIINTNDFEPGLTQIVRENSSYYLLGYQPANVKADGKIRRLDVKVNRPDVEVRHRKNYVAPAPPDAKAAVPPSANLSAIADIVPKTDLPMQIAIAPFANGDESGAIATLVVGLQRPAQAERAVEELELLVRAFTPEGDPRGSDEQKIALNIPPARRGETLSRYDLLAQLPLKPGRYRIRASAHNSTQDKAGSVYADVDVPDFARDAVSLSGVAITVVPGQPVAPQEAFAEIMPVLPTTAREFARFERPSAFLRVYQGGTAPLAPVTVTTRIVDAQDKTVVDRPETVAADRFGDTRSADVRYTLPVAQLPAGTYLLTFEATAAKGSARRDVVFTIR